MSNYTPNQLRTIAGELNNKSLPKDNVRNVAARIIGALADEQETIKQLILYGSIVEGYEFIGPFNPKQLSKFMRDPRNWHVKNSVKNGLSDIITMSDPKSYL